MDLEMIILGEESQRKTNIIWYYLHVKLKKKHLMNLFPKQKDSQRKQTYSYQRGKRFGVRDKLGGWN